MVIEMEYEATVTIEKFGWVTVEANSEEEARQKIMAWDTTDEGTEYEEIKSIDSIKVVD